MRRGISPQRKEVTHQPGTVASRLQHLRYQGITCRQASSHDAHSLLGAAAAALVSTAGTMFFQAAACVSALQLTCIGPPAAAVGVAQGCTLGPHAHDCISLPPQGPHCQAGIAAQAGMHAPTEGLDGVPAAGTQVPLRTVRRAHTESLHGSPAASARMSLPCFCVQDVLISGCQNSAL